MAFARRLQQALAEKKMTQTALAELLGINSQSVSTWCKNGTLPRRDMLELLPSALGKPLYWFFLTEEDEALLGPTAKNRPLLDPKQTRLLSIFDQLPDVEQERFIELAANRLEELDAFITEYLNRRQITRL